jgi:hypothetical protein
LIKRETVDYIKYHGGIHPPWGDKEFEEMENFLEER